MTFELSPEAMRSPLRSVAITFRAGDRDKLIAQLPIVADRSGFAIRLSTDPAQPSDTFVQMYRSDIKMIGWMPSGAQRLDLTVYRTLHRVPAEGVEQGVGTLRTLAIELPNGHFEQTIFERGDDMALEPRTGKAPVRSARFTHADGAQIAIKQQLARFADAHGYAARFTQTTPDPKDLSVYLYSESLNISVGKTLQSNEMSIYVDLTGDRSATQAVIDHTFQTLRRNIGRVPSVSFTAQP